MDVIDERIFLEEVSRRLNRFFRDFPIEADRIFGEPQAFGSEVATMFEIILGENVEVPFAVLLQSILTVGTGTEKGHFLKMIWDDDVGRLVGFEVVEVGETDTETIIEGASAVLGIDPPKFKPPKLN